MVDDFKMIIDLYSYVTDSDLGSNSTINNYYAFFITESIILLFTTLWNMSDYSWKLGHQYNNQEYNSNINNPFLEEKETM